MVIGGRLHLGLGHAGEIGHTTVDPDGPLCGCGNRGCLDRMASAAVDRRRGRAARAWRRRPRRRGPATRSRGPRSRAPASTWAACWPARWCCCGPSAWWSAAAWRTPGELLLDPLRAELRRRACVAPEIPVVPAELGPARGRRGRRAVGRRGQPRRVTTAAGSHARVLEGADEHGADRPDRPEVAGPGERPDRHQQDRQRDHRRDARDLAPRPRRCGAGRSATSGSRSARVRAAKARLQALLELVGIEPAGGGVRAERLGDLLAFGVGGS